MRRFYPLLVGVFLIGFIHCNRDGVFYPSGLLTGVPIMHFYLDSEDYTRLLSNKTNSLKVPVKIYIEDKMIIGEVRATGGGSRYDPRWSYRVVLRSGETLDGLSEFTLSAQVNDPTMIHTAVVSALYKKTGFPIFDSHHVFLRINNRDAGLYLQIEVIKEPFFIRRNLPVNELYKVGFGTDFYLQEAHDIHFSIEKEIPSDENYASLLQFVEVLNKSPAADIQSNLEPFLDIENYISYHALTSLINNVDAFRNNFYMLRESPISPLKIVPWDFDRSFERSNEVGLAGRNAIIEKLLQNPDVFAEYKNRLRLYLNEVFIPDEMFPRIDSVAAMIKEAYQLDPFLGNGRYIFDNEVSALKEYIITRRNYLEENIPNFKFEKGR